MLPASLAYLLDNALRLGDQQHAAVYRTMAEQAAKRAQRAASAKPAAAVRGVQTVHACPKFARLFDIIG